VTIKTRLSVLALAAAATMIATAIIATDSRAADKTSRREPPRPVASHAHTALSEQTLRTGTIEDFRRIPAHKNLTPPSFAPHGLCAECHTPVAPTDPAAAH
jgi:hypothetical protein